MHLSLYAPNGQWGCLTIFLGPFALCVGFTRELWGADLAWKSKMWVLWGKGKAL